VVEHLPAVEAAIDVVAEVDQQVLAGLRLRLGIFDDPRFQLAQQIDTPVDVANRIYPHAFGHARRAPIDLWRFVAGFARRTLEKALEQGNLNF
jgi:hypothetical protein